MSDVSYYRVNVSTATSTPSFNELGDQIAEIEMMLPANILSIDPRKVKKAQMAVMKMEVPLAHLPASSIEVTSMQDANLLVTTGIIGVLPMHFDLDSNSMLKINTGSKYFVEDINYMLAKVYNNATRLNYQHTELARGYHDFASVNEFLDFLNFNLDASYMLTGGYKKPEIKFEQRSDNTISLVVRPLANNSLFAPWFSPSQEQGGQTRMNLEGRIFREFPAAASSVDRYKRYDLTEGCFIFVNEEIYKKLPSLPWIKLNKRLIDNPLFRERYPEDYLYILNTMTANVTFRKNENVFYGQYTTDTIEYNFVESDAISTSNISSIVLTMNGATFNQQVYPVNMSAKTSSASQTATMPVIEVYYPLWNRPSDMTTVMIISHENFLNAAPITINPNMLRERTLKFKLHYITVEGKMREMTIPKGCPFSFQLCFGLEMRN